MLSSGELYAVFHTILTSENHMLLINTMKAEDLASIINKSELLGPILGVLKSPDVKKLRSWKNLLQQLIIDCNIQLACSH